MNDEPHLKDPLRVPYVVASVSRRGNEGYEGKNEVYQTESLLRIGSQDHSNSDHAKREMKRQQRLHST